jgi:inner membrane transporter RhtA
MPVRAKTHAARSGSSAGPACATVKIAGMTRVPAPALVLAAAVSVQVGAAFAKGLFDQVGPPGVVLLRLVFGGVVVLALTRPAVRGRPRRDLAPVVGLGVVLACMNTTFYEALDRLPLGIAVTVEFLGPLAVAVVSSRRRLDLLWIALAGGGIALLAHPGGTLDRVGLILAAAAAVCWGLYIVLGVRVGRRWPGASGLAVSMAIGAVLSAPLGIASGGSGLLDPYVLGGGLLVGLLCSALPWSLEIEAMRRLPTHVFGVLMSVEPAIAALSGLVVLGERLQTRLVASVALVCAASLGAALGARDPVVPVDA